MESDAASWLDPVFFSVGFSLACGGIMLSQWIRDHSESGSLVGAQRPPNSFIFGLTRKITALAILIASFLGFWIVGWWWVVVGFIMAHVGGALVYVALRGNSTVASTYVLCLTGFLLLNWSWSPILRYWGVVP